LAEGRVGLHSGGHCPLTTDNYKNKKVGGKSCALAAARPWVVLNQLQSCGLANSILKPNPVDLLPERIPQDALRSHY
jgi:hypothetical protein